MATLTYDFFDLPVMQCSLYAAGQAEIEYSGIYSGFIVRDIRLAAHDAKQSSGRFIGESHKYHADFAEALAQHDTDAIETAIRDNTIERRAA